jgi:hypothetical protein
MDRRLDEFGGFLRRYVLFVGGSLGAALLIGGWIASPHTGGGTVLIAVGGAVFAAVVLSVISLSREDLLDALFRQGVVEVFPSRHERCKDVYWRDLLMRVSREYRVLGVANNGYTGPTAKEEAYTQLFTAAIVRGVLVEILWLSPTADVAVFREAEEDRATRLDTYKSILFFWNMRTKLDATVRDKLVLREHEYIPSCGITQADTRFTVTHYVPGQDNLDSPGWILTATAYPFYRRVAAFLRLRDSGTELVAVYLDTLKEVQAKSKLITEDRIKELESKRDEFDRGLPSQADRRRERGGTDEDT